MTNDAEFSIESATNGFVLALYLAAALFLGVAAFYVMQDAEERAQSAAEAEESTSQAAPAEASADAVPLA
jgi:uncharacterized protein HemX